MRKSVVSVFSIPVIYIIFLIWVLASGQIKTTSAIASKEAAITDRVIDPACYLIQGKSGPSHKKCAQGCAKAGQTLAILEDKTGKIYVSLSEEMGGDPNAKILYLAEEKITVTGTIISKGGFNGIIITKAEKAGSTETTK